jgi:micrococcal nuclease
MESSMSRISTRYGLLLATLGLAALLLAPARAQPATCAMPPRPQGLLATFVTRVVDGDTVRVAVRDGGSVSVRLLGIDAPERADPLGRLSTEFTRRHLDRRDVGLEFDVRQRDRFDRLLAYVWVADGTLFNLRIVREGYAQVLTIPPNVRYAEVLLACQQEARRHNRGLWGR